MEIDPEKRLGSKNFNEIKNHIFFKDIIWEDVLLKKYTPPFIPKNSLFNNFRIDIKEKICIL